MTKKCPKCKKDKPADKEHFSSRGDGRLQSWCRVCQRQNRMEAYWKDPEKERQNARIDYRLRTEGVVKTRYNVRAPREGRGPVLPSEPFRQWVDNKVAEVGIGNAAMAIGVDPVRLRVIITGEYTKNGKVYEVKNLSIAFIIRAVEAFGEQLHDVYP